MLTRTVLGKVIGREVGRLIILLERGNEVILRTRSTTLKLGSKCHCCIDSSTGKVIKVMDFDTPTVDTSATPSEEYDLPDEDECQALECLVEESFLGVRNIEIWENEEIRESLGSFLGVPRCEYGDQE